MLADPGSAKCRPPVGNSHFGRSARQTNRIPLPSVTGRPAACPPQPGDLSGASGLPSDAPRLARRSMQCHCVLLRRHHIAQSVTPCGLLVVPNSEIARCCEVSRPTVITWRKTALLQRDWDSAHRRHCTRHPRVGDPPFGCRFTCEAVHSARRLGCSRRPMTTQRRTHTL
jgi:hypothetical protein